MRRSGPLIFLALYVTALLFATVASAQGIAVPGEPVSFSVFFWRRIEWANFGTAAFISLVCGAVRTGATLLNKEATKQVFLVGLVDAFISLAVGAIAFLILMIYQAARGEVNPWFMLGFITAAGLLRGDFLTMVQTTVKGMLASASDALVKSAGTTLAALGERLTAIAARRADSNQPPKDNP